MTENTSKDSVPLLTPASEIPPNLGPLNYAGSELEDVLRLMFIDLINEMVRPKLDELNAIGMPHRAPLPVVQQAIKLDGLALERPDADESYIRQLYKSWRARNPRRGLSFLTHYLQMLWPGLWQCKQLWQDPALPYPTGTVSQERPGYFLTSRVLVSVEHPDSTGEVLEKIRGSLRSVLAARLVILIALLRKFDNQTRLACAFSCIDMVGTPGIRGGTALPPPPPEPRPGLVGLWQLDGSLDNSLSGGAVISSSGTAVYEPGRFGSGLHWSASGQIATSAEISGLNATGGIMIDGWLFWTGGGDDVVVAELRRAGARQAGIGIRPSNATGLLICVSPSGYTAQSGKPDPDTWAHYCFAVYDDAGTSSVAWAINGVWYPATNYGGSMLGLSLAMFGSAGGPERYRYDSTRVVSGSDNFPYTPGVNFTPPASAPTIYS